MFNHLRHKCLLNYRMFRDFDVNLIYERITQ